MLHNKWLRLLSLVMVLGILGGCATPTPEVVKETVVVEKVVTQVVKETVKETVVVEGTPQVVEKEVTKIVEKVVTPPPAPGTAEEAKSKSIVLAAHTDILSLDPHRIMEIWGSFVLNHCYDTFLHSIPRMLPRSCPVWPRNGRSLPTRPFTPSSFALMSSSQLATRLQQRT